MGKKEAKWSTYLGIKKILNKETSWFKLDQNLEALKEGDLFKPKLLYLITHKLIFIPFLGQSSNTRLTLTLTLLQNTFRNTLQNTLVPPIYTSTTRP